LVQRDRAVAAGYELAASRGHEPVTLEAKPSFANILVWKIVYRSGNSYYVDAVRAGFEPSVYEGQQVAMLDLERDFPWLEHGTQQASDVERFRWFSNGYLARDPEQPNRIIDIRYSLLPNEVSGLWSIELSPDAGPGEHVGYSTHRDAGPAAVELLWAMIAGSGDSGGQARFGGG
jgi:inner membrane protein